MKNPQELAITIKELAKFKQVTVRQMLSDCGLSVNTLSSMQSGGYFPRLEAIAKIADYFDCSIDYLLGRSEIPDTLYISDSLSAKKQESPLSLTNELSSMYNSQITKIRIKELCKAAKISEESVLTRCELGTNAIRQINDKKGMASYSLAKIADILNCSVDYLLGRTDTPDIIRASEWTEERQVARDKMNCFFCKGHMEKSTTTHMIELESCILIIKNVPCLKCRKCGEVSFTSDVIEQLDRIADLFKNAMTEVAVVNYSAA